MPPADQDRPPHSAPAVSPFRLRLFDSGLSDIVIVRTPVRRCPRPRFADPRAGFLAFETRCHCACLEI